MTNTATSFHPVERQNVHKSCRTIESLLTVLSDYSEAASALATIQKKLSRALREAAALKTNAKYAANAFSASSSILEVLADVDSKFAKLAEKETRGIVLEFKKWLKKLARDEKAHDDRMNDANARIKQAGQAYEKKSKRGAKDAGDEHARYINVLSVLGPEMSQEKYNHSMQVTQNNTSVTFNVAASLSRIADAEWTRVCECMRRISPTVGSLGEWRSLCEGSWTGPLPDDLPNVSSETGCVQVPTTADVSEWGQTATSRGLLPIPPAHALDPISAPVQTPLGPPRASFSTVNQNQGSINSITTLSAFPFPPTHFPVPLATNEAELQRQQTQLQDLPPRVSAANPVKANGALAPPTPPAPILSDSPKQLATADLPESLTPDVFKSSHPSQVPQTPSSSHQSLVTRIPPEALPIPEPVTPEDKEPIKPIASGGDLKKPRRPSLVARVPPPWDKPLRPVPPFKRAEQSSAEDFGVYSDGNKSAFKSHSVDAAKKNLERTDSTHSAGSNVAALRNRYTRTVEIPTEGPKDIPRLPMSVSEIASRYQPVDEPLSPRRTASPIVDRFPLDAPRTASRDLPLDENEIRKPKQCIEELAELELKKKELEHRLRQRDLDHRTRDLERDRLQFLHTRPETSDGPPRGPRHMPFQHTRGSQSVTHLHLPSPSTSTRPSTPHLPAKDHAPSCGCNTCSVSKYKAKDVSPSPRDLRPPEPPILLRPEKPKGWIRRLSMPSVNMAFSLDGKKNASVSNLKAGLPLSAENSRLRKRSYEAGIGHRTLMGIGR